MQCLLGFGIRAHRLRKVFAELFGHHPPPHHHMPNTSVPGPQQRQFEHRAVLMGGRGSDPGVPCNFDSALRMALSFIVQSDHIQFSSLQNLPNSWIISLASKGRILPGTDLLRSKASLRRNRGREKAGPIVRKCAQFRRCTRLDLV